MKSSVTRYFIVPAVLLVLALSGCGSGGDGQSAASTVSGTQASLTAQDIATAKAIENAVASLDANDAALAKTIKPAAPVAGEVKVFGKSIFMVPKSGTLSVSKFFAGLVNGAQGTLVFYNSFGKDIPTTPCVGTAKQIKVCEAARAIALAWNPTSVEVILNGQTVIAPNQIPRTQGKALIPVTVNVADTLKVNLSGPAYSFIQLEVWSMPTAPVALNPTADFSYTLSSGVAPAQITLNASSSSSPNGTITNYGWDFGDGTTGTGVNASHVYFNGGAFNVVLTVTDSAGKSASKSVLIGLAPPLQNPTADFTFTPTTGSVPLTINIDASLSSSPNGVITNYVWDYSDGFANWDIGISNPTHTFYIEGTYSITLTVTDSAGKTATKTSQIVVQPPVLPIASFTYTVDSSTGAIIVNVDGSTSTSPNGAIVTYAWSWGDGSPIEYNSVATASHTYLAPGTYALTLIVYDSVGNGNSLSQLITVP